MIHNQEQLELVREQLGRLERALKDLEDEVRPQSEKQFRLMSEIYVEHIDKLRREIDEYRAARAGDPAWHGAGAGSPPSAARRSAPEP